MSTDDEAKPSAGPLPTGNALSPLDPAFRECPHAILDRLRREDPVHRDGQLDRWFLTRYEDVRTVAQDRELWLDPRKARATSFARKIIQDPARFIPWMTHLDEPDHKRLRGLVSKAFNVRAADAFRPRIEAIATELLDRIASADRFDVVRAYASPLPVRTIADILGVDPAHEADFERWSAGLAHVFSAARTPEQNAALASAVMGLRRHFKEAVDDRRKNRRDDLISALVSAEEEGDSLTEDEIIGTCNLLLVAGNLTTTDLIGNAVFTLLRHPRELEKLRADPALIANAVEEILRYEPPISQLVARVVPSRRDVGGVSLEAGETITGSLLAAARDPAANPDPHTFDIERADVRHLSFGGGIHHCLGSALARAETQIAITALFERFPRLRLDPDTPVAHKSTPGFNGLDALWVRAV